jgi:hypothetical protein
MQAVEGMTRLIALADELIKEEGVLVLGTRDLVLDGALTEDIEMEELKLAAAVCTAMLNTALPVAKYRVFVRFDKCFPKEEIGTEYTLCGVRMSDIRAALRSLDHHNREVYITIFEQGEAGADMISGYQGQTSTINRKYRKWLDSLSALESQ